MVHRREFLKYGIVGTSFVSLAGSSHGLLARVARAAVDADQNDHVLVVVELSGGNDGLNTLIPFENPLYYKNRPTLGIAKEQVVTLTEQLGLHSRMGAWGELFKEGQLAVVQGVGYPEPDRSHFRSMEIWHTASVEKVAPPAGWLGAFLDTLPQEQEDRLPGLTLTGSLPQAMQAQRSVVPVVAQLASFNPEANPGAKANLVRELSTAPGSEGTLEFMRKQARAVYRASERLKAAESKYQSQVEYPQTDLGNQLRQAAQIINADLGVRVLFASQGGYDTHSEQANSHGNLLEELSNSVSALLKDLTALNVARKVVVMVFSEFGRRVDENGSQGTDHGAASVMFLAGAPVQGGLVGDCPSLEQLGDGDLIFNTDFRSVYATLLEGWLGCRAEDLLVGNFPRLPLLKPTL